MVKLDDISADFVATLSGPQILDACSPGPTAMTPAWPRPCAPSATWRCGPWPSSGRGSKTRARTCASGRTSARSTATSSRRSSSWSPTRPTPGSAGSTGPRPCHGGRFAAGYQPPAPGTVWFDQIRDLAAPLGFAAAEGYKGPGRLPRLDRRRLPRHPGAGHRHPRSPDLAQTAGALGPDEVLRRVTALICLFQATRRRQHGTKVTRTPLLELVEAVTRMAHELVVRVRAGDDPRGIRGGRGRRSPSPSASAGPSPARPGPPSRTDSTWPCSSPPGSSAAPPPPSRRSCATAPRAADPP